MNTRQLELLAKLYSKYVIYGAGILLTVCAIALLIVTFLPGPYTMNFFGVVAESSSDSASASIGFPSIILALLIAPMLLAVIEISNKKS